MASIFNISNLLYDFFLFLQEILISFVENLAEMRRLRNCGQILGAEFVVFARGTTIHGVPNMAAKKLHPLER